MRQFINNRSLLHMVLEAERSKIKELADSVCGQACFLAHRLPSLHCNIKWQKGPGSSLGPLW